MELNSPRRKPKAYVVSSSALSQSPTFAHSLESRVATRLESINLGNALSYPWMGRRPMANSVENHLHYICGVF